MEDGFEDSAPPFYETSVVKYMFAGVFDAAGEEVLVLGAGEEGDDELTVFSFAVVDEVGDEDGGDCS